MAWLNKKTRSKIKIGWQKRTKTKELFLIIKLKKQNSNSIFLKNIIIRPKKIYLAEKIVKTIIWIALRLTIRPTHWRDNKKNHKIIDKAYKRIRSSDFVYIPPAFAFYLTMAFLPIVLLILLTISNFPIILKSVEDMLEEFLGPGGSSFYAILKSIKDANAKGIASLVTVILASLWLASAGFAKFIYTQSYLYGHDKVGSVLINRLKGAAIVASISVYCSIMVTSFAMIPITITKIGIPADSSWFDVLKIIFFSIKTLIFVYLGFIALFKFSPKFKLTWKQIHPGALATTIPVSIFLLLFTQLTKLIFKYEIYGPLAVFLVLSASMFQLSYFIYVGIIVNIVFYQTHHSSQTTSKKYF